MNDEIISVFLIILLPLLMLYHSCASADGKRVEASNVSVRWIYYSTLAISVLLLTAYATLSCSIYDGLISWPHIGSFMSFYLYIFFPGIVFQLLFIVYSIAKARLPLRRGWLRLLSIILGFILATTLAGEAQTIARQRFEVAYHPLVDLVKLNLPDPCNPAVAYYDNELLNGLRKVGKLRHDQENFVLLFPAGSADIDGSNIFYSSKTKKWAMFHGDSQTGWDYLRELSEEMAECQIR